MKKTRSGGDFCRLLAVLTLVLVPAEGTGEEEGTQNAKLTVSFATLDATATERGEVAAVSIVLDRPADRQETIPLITYPEAGHFKVPDSVVFNEGDERKTVVVIAIADDNLADESVSLYFGDLPANVFPGDQTTTTVSLRDAGFESCVESGKAWCSAFGVGLTLNNSLEYEEGENDGPLTLRFADSRRPAAFGGFLFPIAEFGGVWTAMFVATQFGGGVNGVFERLTIGFASDAAGPIRWVVGGGFRRVKTPGPAFVKATHTEFDYGQLDDEARFDGFDPNVTDDSGKPLFTGEPLVESTDFVWFLGMVVPIDILGR